mgnify:CR=1 FL=1
MKEIKVATEHHLNAVSRTLNDSILYSQRLLELFLGKNASVTEKETISKINRSSGSHNERTKKIESNLGTATPSSFSSQLILPNVSNPVSRNSSAWDKNNQSEPINDLLHKEKMRKKN